MTEVMIKSVPIVALLRLHDIHPIATGRDQAGKHTFTFQRTAQVQDLLNGFYSDTLTVPARPFADAMYHVKKAFVS